MNMADIKRLVRIYRRADEVGLAILSCSVQRALLAVAHKDKGESERRMRESVRFCEIAMSGTDKAREFAPGAKAIIQNILKKEFDNGDSGGKI